MKMPCRVPTALCALVLASIGGLSCVGLDRQENPVEVSRAEPVRPPPAAAMDPRQLDALVSRVAPDLDDELRGRLVSAVLLESSRNGYDPIFLLSLVGVESRWRLSAESERGARGLLQMKPSTFAWISAREPDVGAQDLETGDDPVVDVRLAIRYFAWLELKFKSRDAALMAYNAGPRRTRQHLRAGDVPDALRAYPQRVRHEYERLIQLSHAGRDLSGALAVAR